MSQVEQQIRDVVKHNKYILTALVDRNFNMIKLGKDGKPALIEEIPEYRQLVDESSMECNFVIDELWYQANGCQPIPYKFNYLLDPNHTFDPITDQKYVKRYRRTDLMNILYRYEKYKNKPLFFTGSSDLIVSALPYINTIMLTVVDHDYSEDGIILDKFPVDEARKYFTKRKIYESNYQEVRQQTASGLQPSNREITILNDYFKLVKKTKKLTEANLPYYRFIHFTE